MPEIDKNERSFEKNELNLRSIWWIPRMSVKSSSYQEKLLVKFESNINKSFL